MQTRQVVLVGFLFSHKYSNPYKFIGGLRSKKLLDGFRIKTHFDGLAFYSFHKLHTNLFEKI